MLKSIVLPNQSLAQEDAIMLLKNIQKLYHHLVPSSTHYLAQSQVNDPCISTYNTSMIKISTILCKSSMLPLTLETFLRLSIDD